jgi:predicted PurR-regulated permease PerM
MSTLQSALLNWNPSRLIRVIIGGTAVFFSLRVTDEFLVGLTVAVVLAVVLDIPWWLYNRHTQSADG